jgi:hypothetical protein
MGLFDTPMIWHGEAVPSARATDLSSPIWNECANHFGIRRQVAQKKQQAANEWQVGGFPMARYSTMNVS